MNDNTPTPPQPSTPHVALSACVSGQYISQADYDAMAAIAHPHGMTVAQYVSQIIRDNLKWCEEAGNGSGQ